MSIQWAREDGGCMGTRAVRYVIPFVEDSQERFDMRAEGGSISPT